jgi:dihydrofolate synthase/folylpolyglutamate synthase
VHLSTLDEWLAWMATVHTADIELGLDRVRSVAARLDLLTPSCPVVTVAGTNGKGSTVAGLEAVYLAAQYRVGVFTTPYLLKYNEEMRVNGQDVSDAALCEAFAKVEAARRVTPLTVFEFGTLAALLIFKSQPLDVVILEVGLGGRLDAVNIIDADIAVITSIGIDHVDWLGPTRESIAIEKAGIMRPGKPVVCGELNPPSTLLECAAKLNVTLYRQGIDFYYDDSLPVCALAKQNMATVLMVVTLLDKVLPVTRQQIEKAISIVKLAGRIQIIPGPIQEIHDVSHNPEAVKFLINKLKTMSCDGKTHAVFSMLADKDIEQCVQLCKDVMQHWYVAPLQVKRAASKERLQQTFQQAGIRTVNYYDAIGDAYRQVRRMAVPGDRVIVFGSFYTLAHVLKATAPPPS